MTTMFLDVLISSNFLYETGPQLTYMDVEANPEDPWPDVVQALRDSARNDYADFMEECIEYEHEEWQVLSNSTYVFDMTDEKFSDRWGREGSGRAQIIVIHNLTL